jgi:replicative DNA helicase
VMEFDLSKLTNLDSERSILGTILVNPESIFQCGDLRNEYFFLDPHQIIFDRMRTMSVMGTVIEPISVCDRLRADNQLVKIGDAPYIASLIDWASANIDYHLRSVIDSYVRRSHVNLCNSAIQQAFDLSETTESCISFTHDQLLRIAGSGNHKSALFKDFSFDVYSEIKRLSATSPYESIGLTTGIPSLDRATTGIRAGEFWVLGSWTGSGKTALLTQIVAANARNEVPLLWFTQEMTKRQVMLRIIPGLTAGRIRAKDLRNPRNMSASELALFAETQQVVDKWPLWVNDTTTLDVANLSAHARMMIQQHGIKLVAVDYLQLLKADAPNRYERFTKVSETLRELSKSTGVPVIVVSQLSRPEDKKLRPPRPFDLKECGNIENDAHVIIMPYRPQDRDGHYTLEDVISVGKQREGPTGTVKVQFSTTTLTFDPRGEDEELGGMF